MKEIKRFEIIIESVQERIQEEVSGLIGAELKLEGKEHVVITKDEFFDQPLGKQILARLDITGEIEGVGGLFVSVKDAIRLGGTLIMLPPSELEDVVASENYDGETEDSYGEIANILAGSFTKVFEEMHPKACRFIRKEQEVVVPLKVESGSGEPIPEQLYFQISMGMMLDGKQLGDLFVLIPAVAFGLAEEPVPAEPAVEQSTRNDEASIPDEDIGTATEEAELRQDREEQIPTSETPADSDEQEVSLEDAEKQKKRIDALLKACQEKLEEEVGVLLGIEVKCSTPENKLVDKEQFFHEEVTGKQVVAHMEVTGDLQNSSYLYIGLKDAIRIGGTLIMLPPNELDAAIGEEDFSIDCQDAYGEIANIISGVYTSVFEEQYTKSLRFIKKDIELVVPLKVDLEDDQPMPDQPYYISTMKLKLDGTDYGNLHMAFPAGLIGLEVLAKKEEETQTVEAETYTGEKQATADGSIPAGDSSREMKAGEEDVLIVCDSDQTSMLIKSILERRNLSWRQVSSRDSIKNLLPGNFKAVFLVMNRVDEQLFGVAIKVNSCCSLPLIAAAPEWTRSKVIRAVKYGVTDILLTPAAEEDVEEKIQNNIVKMAA